MTRILWLSRHDPLPSQEAALRSLFGADMQIVRDARLQRLVGDAPALAEQIRRAGCDEFVIVAPLSIIAVLVDQGLRPLWAEMERVPPDDPRAEVRMPGHGTSAAPRCFRFDRFRRITGVQLEFNEL